MPLNCKMTQLFHLFFLLMFYFNVMVEFQIDLAQILKLGFKVRVDLGGFLRYIRNNSQSIVPHA